MTLHDSYVAWDCSGKMKMVDFAPVKTNVLHNDSSHIVLRCFTVAVVFSSSLWL